MFAFQRSLATVLAPLALGLLLVLWVLGQDAMRSAASAQQISIEGETASVECSNVAAVRSDGVANGNRCGSDVLTAHR
jgi:hypothetical protein